MTRFWEFCLRAPSKSGQYCATVVRCLSDIDYADPQIRAWEEEYAERQIRRVEGIYEDTPLEHFGWREIVLKEE